MPDWKQEIEKRLAGLALEPAREAEIIEELSQHVEDRHVELVAGGATAEQASRAVLAELSYGELLSRELRRVELAHREPVVLGASRGSNVIRDLLRDLGYGLRLLRKHPGFTAMAVLTLALGIGVNIAVFSVVSAVLLKPLPYPEPDRLVVLQNQFLARNLMNAGVSAADYSDYRDQKHIFEEVAAGLGTSFNLTGAGRTENVPGMMVTSGFFTVLGVRPVAGRTFSEAEDRPGFNQAVVLGEGFWKRRFGGDPGIIGATLQLNDQSYTVVGIVPPAPEFLGPSDVFAPAAFTSEQMNRAARGGRSLFALARLTEGLSVEQAQIEMNAFAQTLAREFPNDYPPESGWGIRVDSASELLVGKVWMALWILMGAVGFVLLIAQRVAFIDQLTERITNLPGVTAVGATSMLPFIGVNSSSVFSIEGRDTPAGAMPHADIRRVTHGFFEAIGIPLRTGRLFVESDTADSPFVALVDEKLAEQYWPGQDPLGERLRMGGPRGPLYTVVGVVAHVKHSELNADSKGALYFLYSQNRAFMIALVVRTSNSPEPLAGVVQHEVWAIDKDVPVFEVKTMDQRLIDTLTPQRAVAYLVTLFAGVALLLAMMGVYWIR